MRILLSILISSLVASCAASGTRTPRAACPRPSTCFYEATVRSFRMLDRDTMIVEVGGRRCPYLVELDGGFCDLRTAVSILFRDANGRICASDNTYVVGGPFATDREDACRVRNVRAVSDDELLERYAEAGEIPPLPPTGPGVLATEGDEGAAPADGSRD